jgi:hypothetical protein
MPKSLLTWDPVSDLIVYCSLVEALQYLTFTRPDHAYTVRQVCLDMHDPHEPHLIVAKHILRYFDDTLGHRLLLHHTSTSDLIVYTDTDWVNCTDSHRSTSVYALLLGDNLISWPS